MIVAFSEKEKQLFCEIDIKPVFFFLISKNSLFAFVLYWVPMYFLDVCISFYFIIFINTLFIFLNLYHAFFKFIFCDIQGNNKKKAAIYLFVFMLFLFTLRFKQYLSKQSTEITFIYYCDFKLLYKYCHDIKCEICKLTYHELFIPHSLEILF